jgi:NAD(P)H dehydrogenase (quinone)
VTNVNVLVAFYSRYGKTEQLALAAGVGAIQARANIRLRRLADLADPKTIQADSEWTAHLDRMNRDYVVPRPADPVWADVIVLVAPEDSPGEMQRYVESLPSLGSMAGKIAAPLTSGRSESVLASIYALSAVAGLIVVPAPREEGNAIGAARTHGRHIASMARALKRDESMIDDR